MEALLETYNVCSRDEKTMFDAMPLVPLYHTVNNANITVTIDIDGSFISADVIDKENQCTIIPCTESSAGRTSGVCPHGLSDKLTYLAGDLPKYITSSDKKSKDYFNAHSQFMEQLNLWIESPFSNEEICAIYKYLDGGTLISDLVKEGIIELSDGKIADKKDNSDAILFLKSKTMTNQYDALVRWRVNFQDHCEDIWTNRSVIDSWIKYQKSCLESTEGLCLLTGKVTMLATNHPIKIRNLGDKAKIISANDTSEFTFRGRFDKAEQAYGIGFEETQKIHSALRWLIGRQGYRQENYNLVVWSIDSCKPLNPMEDSGDIFDIVDEGNNAWTNADAAKHIKNKLLGYNSPILDKYVMLLAIDSAQSGKGRISISTYMKVIGEDYLSRLDKWYTSSAWIHRYGMRESEGKDERYTFVGAPCPKDIAKAAYGLKADNQIIVNTIKRILPCILFGQRIPRDIVDQIVRRASNPQGMEHWEWMKTLSICCSVYKQFMGGIYEMSLEEERTTRDYLYGRLFAYADLMEESALNEANEKRQTTAIRLMQRFSERPYSTWKNIELALVPYSARLKNKAHYYETSISKIMDMFEGDDFRDNSPLSGEFLLAYHCQCEEHFRKKANRSESEVNE